MTHDLARKLKELPGEGAGWAGPTRTDWVTFRNGKCWRPLWSENVQTDAAVTVNIRVVDSRRERNLKDNKGEILLSHDHISPKKNKKTNVLTPWKSGMTSSGSQDRKNALTGVGVDVITSSGLQFISTKLITRGTLTFKDNRREKVQSGEVRQTSDEHVWFWDSGLVG